MYSRISSLFLPMLDAARRLHISQRGQTGMEVALVGVVWATCVIGRS